jgi:hypothetical protein
VTTVAVRTVSGPVVTVLSLAFSMTVSLRCSVEESGSSDGASGVIAVTASQRLMSDVGEKRERVSLIAPSCVCHALGAYVFKDGRWGAETYGV